MRGPDIQDVDHLVPLLIGDRIGKPISVSISQKDVSRRSLGLFLLSGHSTLKEAIVLDLVVLGLGFTVLRPDILVGITRRIRLIQV